MDISMQLPGALPDNARCCVETLRLLAEDYERALEEHFEDRFCITCADTGRDAIPWTELFTQGRQK